VSAPVVADSAVLHTVVVPSSGASSPPEDREAGIYRLSVAQYHEMLAHGVLSEDEPIEFLEGCVITMPPVGFSHRFVVQETALALRETLPSGWDLFVQQPITLAASEPEPNVTVFRGRNADYRDRHPGAADVGLVIEVADTSLAVDRDLKLPIYAASGIVEYWILNLIDRRLEVFRQPQVPNIRGPASYANHVTYLPQQKVPFELDGKLVAEFLVSRLMP
jgi:Uma2 family endonuclease